jgi:hypothetical protein
MARGWESKSVEEQQVEREPQGSPRAGTGIDPERERRRQALELQREQILSARTASPHRRAALAAALAELEARLAEIAG